MAETVSITKSAVMTCKFDVMYIRPAVDLSLFRQTRVISLDHPRTTCCNPWFWCNRRLGCHKIPQGTALDSGQRGEANIRGSDVFDQVIRTAFDKQLFSSVHNISKRKYIPTATAWWRLTNSIGFVVKHLHSVPHKSNRAKLAARIQMSNELLTILYLAEHKWW
jgi:hypothetical protein